MISKCGVICATDCRVILLNAMGATSLRGKYLGWNFMAWTPVRSTPAYYKRAFLPVLIVDKLPARYGMILAIQMLRIRNSWRILGRAWQICKSWYRICSIGLSRYGSKYKPSHDDFNHELRYMNRSIISQFLIFAEFVIGQLWRFGYFPNTENLWRYLRDRKMADIISATISYAEIPEI